MGFIAKVIILAVILLFAVLGYACCLVAATSDEQAERMHREYLEWKRRKEKEDKWKE